MLYGINTHTFKRPPLADVPFLERVVENTLSQVVLHSRIKPIMSARQNYSEECEAAVNRLINIELNASYGYLSLAFYFGRDDVALPDFHTFFKKLSDKERGHSEKLMKYQNSRGGRVLLQDIKKPDTNEWATGLDAMTSSLKLLKSVNQSFRDLHNIAGSKDDLSNFIQDAFMEEQVESIKKVTDFIVQLNRAGSGLGEYLFDKETLHDLGNSA